MSLYPRLKYLFIAVQFMMAVAMGEPDGYFINPPLAGAALDYTENPAYYVGETVQLQWSTGLEDISLALWQQGDNTNFSTIFCKPSSFENFPKEAHSTNPIKPANAPSTGSYAWKASLSYSDATFDLASNLPDTPGNVFFFAIYNSTDTDLAFTSHYFNLSTEPLDAPPGAGGGRPQETPVAGRTPLPSGLSTGQQAGIGVGVSLAGLLAIAALTWFLFFRKGGRLAKGKIGLAAGGDAGLGGAGEGKAAQVEHAEMAGAEAPGYVVGQALP